MPISNIAKADGQKINPATEESVGFIQSIYNWIEDKWVNYVLIWRTSYVDTMNNKIIPAANAIIHDRGIALPLYDYCSQTVVTDTVTYVYKTGGAAGTVVATVVVVYTDATLSTIISITRT